jgi:hypothetical protein
MQLLVQAPATLAARAAAGNVRDDLEQGAGQLRLQSCSPGVLALDECHCKLNANVAYLN